MSTKRKKKGKPKFDWRLHREMTRGNRKKKRLARAQEQRDSAIKLPPLCKCGLRPEPRWKVMEDLSERVALYCEGCGRECGYPLETKEIIKQANRKPAIWTEEGRRKDTALVEAIEAGKAAWRAAGGQLNVRTSAS